MSNRALIVENDPGTIRLLKEHLAEVSDHVQVLTDSRQVEQVFRDFEPDIVVLELHMPDPDALKCCAGCAARAKASVIFRWLYSPGTHPRSRAMLL